MISRRFCFKYILKLYGTVDDQNHISVIITMQIK